MRQRSLTFFRCVGGNNVRRRLLDYTRDYRVDWSCERISVNCDITGKPLIGRDTITPLVRAAAHPAYWKALLLGMGNFLFRTSTEILHIMMICKIEVMWNKNVKSLLQHILPSKILYRFSSNLASKGTLSLGELNFSAYWSVKTLISHQAQIMNNLRVLWFSLQYSSEFLYSRVRKHHQWAVDSWCFKGKQCLQNDDSCLPSDATLYPRRRESS
jgi:hypothetical protein